MERRDPAPACAVAVALVTAMPEDRVPPHESEEFRRALELLGTHDRMRREPWPEGHEIIMRMRAEGRDPIPRALRHGDDRIRFLVTRYLQVMGPTEYLDELVGMLEDPVDDVRMWAVWALEFYDETPPVEPLIRTLDDPHPRIRDSAAWTLGWFADPRALEPLLERARVVEGDAVQPVRDALSALTATALDDVLAALRDADLGVRRIVADALDNAATGVMVMPSVEDELIRTDQNGGEHLRPAVPALIDALDDPDPEVRASVLMALSSLADERALPVLKRLAEHADPQVRLSAAAALDACDDPQGIELYLEALRDPRPDVRADAAGGLHDNVADDGRVLPALVAALDDDAVEVRLEAAWSLAVAEDPRAEEGLRGALNDPDEEVRTAAEDGLQRLGERRADDNDNGREGT